MDPTRFATFFMARPNLIPNALILEKSWNVHFSVTFRSSSFNSIVQPSAILCAQHYKSFNSSNVCLSWFSMSKKPSLPFCYTFQFVPLCSCFSVACERVSQCTHSILNPLLLYVYLCQHYRTRYKTCSQTL